MDNITHALTGSLLALPLTKGKEKSQRKKLFLLAVLLSNLPDSDLILSFWSKQTYLLHHRGLTHSFLGLVLMIPLSFFLLKIFRLDFLSFKQKLAFILSQIILGHFFLDYLTTWGTMLLYPLSFKRFAYPLLFIVDPFLWVTLIVAFTLALLKKKKAFRCALVALVLQFSSSVLLKHHAEHFAASKALHSYPFPLAPLAWNVVEEDLQQSIVSFIPGIQAPLISRFPLPEKYQPHCPFANNSFDAQMFFEWAQVPACQVQAKNCQCFSLKYGVLALDQMNLSGFAVSADGSTVLMDLPTAKPVYWEGYQKLLY